MRKQFGCRIITFTLWIIAAVSLFTLGWQLFTGETQTLTLIQARIAGLDLHLSFRIDGLSSIMLAMVATLAAGVAQYSLRYLDGEQRQWYFFRNLLVTSIFVMLLVLSSNLIMFFVAWWGISWGLHQLLLYNAHRPAAVYAARKKIIIGRLGDIAILAGIGIIYKVCGTFEFHNIFTFAQNAQTLWTSPNELFWSFSSPNFALSMAGSLLVFGAMTKSAQFPFHFWLPETMETPTPVSALMHAGIINAGGFLILRLSPIIAHAGLASLLLTLVGAFTAVYASLVMMTQNSIKKKLADSTISQMGMMMFACGIGAYSIALFHILAHSFYKAHAFLSTGELVEENKHLSLPIKPMRTWGRAVAIALAFSIFAIGAFIHNGEHFAVWTYSAVLFLGFLQCSTSFKSEINQITGRKTHLISVILFSFILAVGAYFVLESGIHLVSQNELDTSFWSELSVSPWGPYTFAVNFISLIIFAAGFWISNELISTSTPSVWVQKLYIHLWNRNSFSIWTTKILSQIWPAETEIKKGGSIC